MENFNTIPSAGTYGSAIALINANFSLTKEQLERLSYSREGFCGMYDTPISLGEAYPNPTTGSFAYVGTSFPMDVYTATNGVWAKTIEDGYSGGGIDLTQYADKASLTALAGRVTALENAGYVFIGIATPSGAPSPSQAKRFALAWAAGTYTYYGGFVLNSGEMAVLMYNGSAWSGTKTDIIAKGVVGGYDTTPTEDSEKPITSGGVYTAMDELRSDMEDELSNVDMEFGSGEYVSDVIIHNSVGQNESVLLTQGGITSFVFNEIDINDIDNLNNVDYAYSPSQSQSKKTSYYTVVTFRGASTTQKVKIGTMAVISDGLASTVTEVMTTRYILDASGNLTGEFSNNDVFTIYRSTSGNTWTQWHYVNESIWAEAISGIRTDLTNYYTKSQTYSKTEVDGLIAAINQFNYVIAPSLPTPTLSTMGVIYLIPSASGSSQNIKDEFITIREDNWFKWEQIGSTAVDLSGYSTTAEMNTAINAAIASALISYYTKTEVNTLLDGKQNVIDDLAAIRSGAVAGATAVQPAAIADFATTNYVDDAIDEATFASGEKINRVSLISTLNNSGNIPKSSAVMDFLQPLITETSSDVTLTNEITGVQISNGKWTSQSQRHIYLIPYTHHNGDSLHIKGNATNGSYYAFLTSDSHTVGSDVPFCIGGQKEWTSVSANQVTEEVIPSNCTYIAINRAYGSGNGFVPAELKVVNKSIPDLDEFQQQIDQNNEYIQQLGSACENQGGTVEETLYGEVGLWDTNGTTHPDNLIRAHLKVQAIGVNSMSITIPSGYYANIYYVNAANVMQAAVLVDWQGVGTVNLELNGLYDLMFNIKYGTAGTTDITATMLAQAPFVVTKSVMSGYNPAAPLSQLEEIEENIAPLIVNTKDYDSWDNSGNPQNIRVRFIYTGIAGAVVTVTANSGYSFGISVYSTTTPTGTAIYDSGWQTGSFTYNVPSTGVGCMTINTAKGNRTVQISYEESVANISRTITIGNRSVTDNAVEYSGDLITSGGVFAALYGGGNFTYRGSRVILESYSFKGVEYMAVSAPSGTGQGAGVYGNYFIQGGAGGHVRVYDLTTKAIVANSINLAVVDSTNHVNNICFSKLFPSGNTDFPYMYVSECTGQGRCFVENFTLNGSTLVQTLSYSGTDLHDTNWVLDYERGYIFLLGNTESSYTVANNKVRVKKFALPLPTAGDAAFTPDDVLDTFDMDGSDGQARVFQGNIISNGKMYSCFGGSQTTHRIWVNNLDNHELLTVIELDQMYTGECESINIWDNSILIGYPNQSKLYQLTF